MAHFLAGHLRFVDIPGLLEDVLSKHEGAADTELEAVLAADAWARDYAEDLVRAKV